MLPVPTTRDHVLAAARAVSQFSSGCVPSSLWHGARELKEGTAFPQRQGCSVLVLNEYHSLVAESKPCSRPLESPPTDSPVAGHCQLLVLDELLPVEPKPNAPADSLTVPIRLISGVSTLQVPSYIECPVNYTISDLQQELACWGLQCDVYCFSPHDSALCVPSGWIASDDHFHYLLCHTDTSDEHGAFLHTAAKALTEIDLMQFLYSCGYWRATILHTQSLGNRFTRVIFQNVAVQNLPKSKNTRSTPSWPLPLPSPHQSLPFFVTPVPGSRQ